MKKIKMLFVLMAVMCAFTFSAQAQELDDPSAYTAVGDFSFVNHTAFLAKNNQNRSAAIWTHDRVAVSRSFSVENDFLIGPTGTFRTADGKTFCLQDQSPNALGAYGRGIGYVGITPSFCLVLKSYIHVGAEDRNVSLAGFVYNGQQLPEDGSGLTPLTVSLHDNQPKQIFLFYDASLCRVEVSITNIFTGEWDYMTHAVNLSRLFPRGAYLGATAATGTYTELEQEYLIWYSND